MSTRLCQLQDEFIIIRKYKYIVIFDLVTDHPIPIYMNMHQCYPPIIPGGDIHRLCLSSNPIEFIE